MKQEERRQQTIQLLLTTTKELIREKGCDSVTMKDIMDRSGLSKGAIFHYVKSKDEIYAWVLQESLEDIDQRFQNRVKQSKKELEGPLGELTKGLPLLNNPRNEINQILVYLLSKTGRPEIDEVLKQFYNQSVFFSRQWIKAGQDHGVIPADVDTQKMGELFVLIALGLRMRSFLPVGDASFQDVDFATLMRKILSP
ncbi:TetR/AcrR family transcriptional regulator [Brevibacillus ruminantium]|uniref:TetR/AcrR family transcriptional regulator n=1 Tax=Brevibacillus ruminantium TaxID=2950604 RepID=A0ABY4W8G2_9BACL|nr:TetR/AcrR family transcriptional regulator [Brevibacillus ruminantium]USG63455.1 TetR/AcrR family transcriptional regulator [Brevibacillus ruminantium]